MTFTEFLRQKGMSASRISVWALIPYWQEGDRLVSESYDTPQVRRELADVFGALGLDWTWVPITRENTLDSLDSLLRAAGGRQPLALNYCDSDPVAGGPGIEVIHALQERGIPFTGADAPFYHISTSKIRMKERFLDAGVSTAPFAVVASVESDLRGLCCRLGAPLFVKPVISAGSFGLSLRSVVHTDEELEAQVRSLLEGPHGREFAAGGLFVETFINGPEFTVLVVGMPALPESVRIYPAVERVFNPALPEAERFFSYDRYWEKYEEESRPPDGKYYEYRAAPSPLRERLEALAWKAYCAVGGTGYGRVDIRMDATTGELFVLEVNANCGISSDENESSTGNILSWGGISFAQLMSEMLYGALIR
jgi:D-alanine-D-alanine ligase